jgi:hypothetical protein
MEREGSAHGAFQDRCLQPLDHSSGIRIQILKQARRRKSGFPAGAAIAESEQRKKISCWTEDGATPCQTGLLNLDSNEID